jgi:ABC-type amino acid transport substrate-binding protein
VLIANSKSKIWLTSPQELLNYKIGTVIDDIAEKFLVDLGVPLSKLDRASSSTQNLEKFKKGRFDLLPYSETGIYPVLKSIGINPQNYRVVFTLSDKQTYFAFNKTVPDPVVLKFQQALDTLRKNGTLDRILKKYGIIPLAASKANSDR